MCVCVHACALETQRRCVCVCVLASGCDVGPPAVTPRSAPFCPKTKGRLLPPLPHPSISNRGLLRQRWPCASRRANQIFPFLVRICLNKQCRVVPFAFSSGSLPLMDDDSWRCRRPRAVLLGLRHQSNPTNTHYGLLLQSSNPITPFNDFFFNNIRTY